jgi:hypothetical protein
MSYKKIKECHLTLAEEWGISFLVTYPVSITYNGGIALDKWYKGFKVAKPKVPQGFELVNIGIGLQLNCRPPYATSYLKPIDGKKVSKSFVKTALSKLSS